MADPVWLAKARSYLGLKEIPGKHHSPTILGWWKKLKDAIRDDETPWCGGYVGGVLAECGLPVVKSPAGARNWLNLPKVLDRPAYGCIVVFWRGKKSGWSGHVGFLVGKDQKGNLMILGGNQGNKVSIKPFSPSRVLGYRWPGITPDASRYRLPLVKSDGTVSTNEA
jgi:uncharacterized protein (TIGR02594 family)